MLRTYRLRRMAGRLLVIFGFAVLSAIACTAQDEAVLAAGGSTEPSPASKALLPIAGSEPGASLPAPLSSLLLELQQLKETVEGQSERIAKQNEELESERANLKNQLDRIAKLEIALQTTPGSGARLPAEESTIALSSGPASNVAGPANVAAVPAVPAQDRASQGSVDRRLGELEQRLKKIGPLSFSGDFRLRELLFLAVPAIAHCNRTCKITACGST